MHPHPSRRCVLGTAAAAAVAVVAPPLAAFADAPRIGSATLLQDARIFERAYGALHPGLLRYNTAAEMTARFEALRAYLRQPRTLGEAHLAFARVAAGVRCGHSYLNPFNQTGAALNLNADGRTRLPFRFRWIGGRMIVDGHSLTDPSLEPGTEIVSIGGIACGRLLRELLPLAHADGHNDAARVRQMERRGEAEWEAFDIYLPLLRPDLLAGGVARLEVRANGADVAIPVEVALLNRQRPASAIKADVAHGVVEPLWRLERLEDGVAWLAMPSWAVFDSAWDWRAALDAMIDEAASDKVRALVVDLRGNAGGLSAGDMILAHRVERDLPTTPWRRKVRYRATPPDLDGYLQTWDRSFRDWGARAVGPDAAGFYSLSSDGDAAETAPIRPRGRRFTGQLIVLVDAANSSATFSFAQTVKTQGLGDLVGETTGGSRRGINGGAFFFLHLPGSGLEIDVPLIGEFPSSPQPDRGIEPDVAVATSQADLARGVDPQRIAALRMAAR